MSRKLAFIHTVSTAFSQFDALAKEILPKDVMVYHITDEILAKVVLAQGGLSPFLYRRVTEHARSCTGSRCQRSATYLLFYLALCRCRWPDGGYTSTQDR